jgi:UDP-glucose-4-epimerase GalE
MSVLVTGGAGYIGSVVADHLAARGERVVVIDDLSRGDRQAVPHGVEFVEGRVGDRDLVATLVADQGVEACLHFAGLIAVGESVHYPLRYYGGNVGETIGLLEALTGSGVQTFVFSSSAAVYGEPEVVPIPENHRIAPTSPYGRTKAMVEQALADLAAGGLMRSVALRYFNAAGATARVGERHRPETHLIPLAIDAVLGTGPPLVVFGGDYPTPDGTAVRDYIHVDDLAAAHLAALDFLSGTGGHHAVNLGNGAGASVLEVVDAVATASGRPVPYEIGPRRTGDPARLVASNDLAANLLGWRPAIPALADIVASAWEHRSTPG